MIGIGAGSAILLAESPRVKPHLWLVLSDVDSLGRVIAVMLRTQTRFTDDTLVLQVGDHPFIRHPTAVHYSTAQWLEVRALERAALDGRCHPRAPASPDLVARARSGLLASPFTVHAVADACRVLWATS